MKTVVFKLTSIILLIIFSQIYGFSQQTTGINIIIDSYDIGNKNYIARDEVLFAAGYSYYPMSIFSMVASADPDLILEAEYIPPENAPNPDSRELDLNCVVGAINGSAGVTPNGSATYNIPLNIPPGTANMIPSVSISYMSQNPGGDLGVGWSIAGLSAISRTGRNLYFDGEIAALDFSSNDRFLLDGQRMIKISGTYGADGSTYDTEIESFNIVTAHGSEGNGPQWLEVKTKDGQTLEYGRTIDSRIKPEGGNTPYMWRLNKVKDIYGNYISYTYLNEQGESVIKKISYTGQEGGADPYNEINFKYVEKENQNILFIGGKSILQKYLLDKIEIFCENNKISDYDFTYIYDDHNTKLVQIDEISSNGAKVNPTIIKWNDKTTPISIEPSFNISRRGLSFGDFDGDGKTDLMRLWEEGDDMKWGFYKNTDGTNFSKINEDVLPKNDFTVYACNKPLGFGYSSDFTGDGMDDVLISYVTYGGEMNDDTCYRYYLLKSMHDSFELEMENVPVAHNDHRTFTGDFDGDGILDLFIYNNNDALPTTNATIFKYIYPDATHQFWFGVDLDADDMKVIDFDGDGRTEIMLIKEDTCKIYKFSYNATNFTWSKSLIFETGYPTKWHQVYPGDFNGDGKCDILTYTTGYGWELSYSNGVAWITSSYTPPITIPAGEPGDYANRFFINDYNGDGKSDIMTIHNLDGHNCNLKVFYSTGQEFVNEIDQNLNNPNYFEESYKFYDFNGDGKVECFYDEDNTLFRFHSNEKSNYISSIANGLNQYDRFIYSWITDNNVYTKENGTPVTNVLDIQAPIIVVSSSLNENATGTNSETTYHYEGAKFHTKGKGFLGFLKTTSICNDLNSKITATNTLNGSCYTLLPTETENKLVNDADISGSHLEYVLNSPYSKMFQINLSKKTETDFLNDNEINSSYLYDAYGNIISDSVNIGGDITVKTNTTYIAYNGTIPNRIDSKTTNKVYKDESPFSLTTDYQYYSNGQLQKVIERQNTSKSYSTEYIYSGRGLVTSETVSSDGLPSKIIHNYYDEKQRFITKTKNPENLYAYAEYDPQTGMVVSETDLMGKTTAYNYDEFGNLIKIIDPRGHEINKSLDWDDGSVFGSALYREDIESPGNPDVHGYFNKEGFTIGKIVEGREGDIYSQKSYNKKGHVVWESEPHYQNDPNPVSFYYSYYPDGRLSIKSIYDPAGVKTTHTFGVKTETITTDGGQSVTKTFNAAGDIIGIMDHGGSMSYKYHSSGQVREIDYGDHIVKIYYNSAGQQDSLCDPNCGTTSYEYDAYDQLKSQTDGKNNRFEMDYDLMGRVISKTGNSQGSNDLEYEYFTSYYQPEKYGLLHTVTGSNGISDTYDYDDFGQLVTKTERINNEPFEYSYQYDNFGRLTRETYPGGFAVSSIYDSKGFLQSMKRYSDNFVLWQYAGEEKPGSVNSFNRGPGMNTQIDFDSYNQPSNYSTSYQSHVFQDMDLTFNHITGNLQNRSDNRHQLTESFTYDNLNRLTGLNGTSDAFQYEDNGNISYKHDVGDYSYNDIKTNAVEVIKGLPGSISTDEQIISYTPTGMAGRITEGDKQVDFTYGPDDQRRISVFTEGEDETTTLYGDGYERVTDISGTTNKYYIGSPNGLVAIVIGNNVYFTITDHLGSITGLVDQSCQNMVEEASFDAWGRRRNPSTWTYENIPEPVYLTRGFTGHENLYAFGLINMNGRMYDPALGRFLSPDNYVQLPFHTQSYNRYSYCLNNPTKYTDPNGEFIPFLYMAAQAAFLNLLQQANAGNINNFKDAALAYGVGFIGSLAGSGFSLLISNVNGIIAGTLLGGIGGGVSGGISGGMTSLAAGQTFKSGFVPGFESGVLSGSVQGGIKGYDNALKRKANPWTLKVGNKRPYYYSYMSNPAEFKQIDPTKYCYAENAAFTNPNDPFPESYIDLMGSDGSSMYEVGQCSNVTKMGAKPYSIITNFDDLGRAYNNGYSIFSTTDKHIVTITQFTVTDRLKIFGDKLTQTISGVSVFDPIYGSIISNGNYLNDSSVITWIKW